MDPKNIKFPPGFVPPTYSDEVNDLRAGADAITTEVLEKVLKPSTGKVLQPEEFIVKVYEIVKSRPQEELAKAVAALQTETYVRTMIEVMTGALSELQNTGLPEDGSGTPPGFPPVGSA